MTGHIRRRGARSWELKYDAAPDPLTGKRRVRYVSFKGTKRAAAIELARLVAQEAAGEGIDPSKTTLAEFLDRWERDWAALNVSPKTFERYSELLRRHVRPHIGATTQFHHGGCAPTERRNRKYGSSSGWGRFPTTDSCSVTGMDRSAIPTRSPRNGRCAWNRSKCHISRCTACDITTLRN